MLHIVHPYIFKLKGETLMMGPVVEDLERDLKISKLVRTAVLWNYPVFVHERIAPPGDAAREAEVAALKRDILFSPLFHPKVTWFGTNEYGLPIHYKKPDDISNMVWESLLDRTVTHSQLADLIGEPDEILVCGGQFSRCESNFMQYIDTCFRKFERRFYIPELSVVHPEDMHLIAETVDYLHEAGFNPLSCEEAMEIIRNPLPVPQYNSQYQQQKSD